MLINPKTFSTLFLKKEGDTKCWKGIQKNYIENAKNTTKNENSDQISRQIRIFY